MQNILFKTSEPTAAKGPVEFYNISLNFQEIQGRRLNVVHEKHGWWSNETGTATFDDGFTSPPEVFDSFSEAVDRYCAIRTSRASEGFMHSFSWHFLTGKQIA
jgi:hypothetical protein